MTILRIRKRPLTAYEQLIQWASSKCIPIIYSCTWSYALLPVEIKATNSTRKASLTNLASPIGLVHLWQMQAIGLCCNMQLLHDRAPWLNSNLRYDSSGCKSPATAMLANHCVVNSLYIWPGYNLHNIIISRVETDPSVLSAYAAEAYKEPCFTWSLANVLQTLNCSYTGSFAEGCVHSSSSTLEMITPSASTMIQTVWTRVSWPKQCLPNTRDNSWKAVLVHSYACFSEQAWWTMQHSRLRCAVNHVA